MKKINENRPGYKETKIGWIPEEWEVKRIDQVAEINPNKPKNINDSCKVIFLRMVDVSENGKILNEHKLNYSKVKNGFTYFEKDDILVAKITPCFENGKGVLLNKLKEKIGFGSTEFHVLRANNIIKELLFYYTRTFHFRKYGEINMVGSAGQKRVPANYIKAYTIPLPPLPEQKKIAVILSNWDKAIDTLEKLITAKEQRKKGLMQQLLTGKKRLLGFNDDWKEVYLGDIFKERVEIGFLNLPLVSIAREKGVIYREETERKDSSSEDKSKYLKICVGDIGYNTMRMWQGVSGISDKEGIVSPAYTIVIPDKAINGQFMSYYFKFPPIINLFFRYSQGLVSDTLNLKYHNFAKVKVKIPKKEEQIEIANLFKKIDKEVNIHKSELECLKQHKKGLMQVLLTGNVRVKS